MNVPIVIVAFGLTETSIQNIPSTDMAPLFMTDVYCYPHIVVEKLREFGLPKNTELMEDVRFGPGTSLHCKINVYLQWSWGLHLSSQ